MKKPLSLTSRLFRYLGILLLTISVPLWIAVGFLVSWEDAWVSAAVTLVVSGGLALGLKAWWGRQVEAPLETLEVTAFQWLHERFDARTGLGAEGDFGRVGTLLDEMATHFEAVFAKLTVKTRTDLVTGRPSRAQLLLDITLAKTPVLFLVNVDSFKEINDSFGNRAGDEVLKQLGGVLDTFHADYQYRLYKMPADEFALLADMALDERQAAFLTEALVTKVSQTRFLVGDTALHIQGTCGVALGQGNGQQPDRGTWPHLVAQADMALKKAKSSQKHYLIFNESMEIQREFEKNLFWKSAVMQALAEDRIITYFQPITDNVDDKVRKFETLVRLEGLDRIVHLPADFLEVARRAHYDGAITKAVVHKAFETFEGSPYEFSVNLTVRDMLSPEVNQYLKDTIAAHPETARRLVVEILESEGIENYHAVKLFLTEVKASGVKVAIDDFGTGYSNFDHLLKLEVDYIKIDASLISHIDTDRNAQIIVKTIVGFSKELGLKTIAEHVHTKEVLETVRGLGVDYSQGFFLGKPGPLGGTK